VLVYSDQALFRENTRARYWIVKTGCCNIREKHDGHL